MTKEIASFFTIITACFLFPVSAASISDRSAAYWAKFRAGVLRGDVPTIATLSRFPLEASLLCDPETAKHITRTQFPMLFRTEIGCPSENGHSTLNLIKNGVRFTGNNYHNAETASVDKFSFRKKAGQWRLTQIRYADIDDFHKRLSGRC